MAPYKAAGLFGSPVAEPILASSPKLHKQAGHMQASEPKP